MPRPPGRDGPEWRRLVKIIKAELPAAPLCWICGLVIDRSLHHRDPMSLTLDHRKPVKDFPELALDPRNLAPAHRSCNGRKGARAAAPVRPKRSRVWD